MAAWLIAGDTAPSAELSITSLENGGTSYFDQTVSFTERNCTVNSYGYNVCTETASFAGPTLNAGTYWVNLQNASVPDGDPLYWDENSGLGCQGQGCPSQASQNDVGSIPSESFTILGETSTTTSLVNDYSCPPPQKGFHELYGVGASVAIDGVGNLFGSVGGYSGPYDAGYLYELGQRAGQWFFSSLYNFLGGSNGSNPSGVIIGPEGVLYGAASGGIQTCGSDGSSYCGLIYQANPGPASCANALCSWNETTIYQFAGNSDAWGGTVSAFDSAGNLYGISASGGTYGYGAVFELTPSAGGWTEKILYSFTGGNDGAGPTSLLVGHNGNLYGTAAGGPYYSGVVFQMVPSGGGWTENVLYAFTGTTDGYWPGGLLQPQGQDYLVGFSICSNGETWPPQCGGYWEETYGLIFAVGPSGGGWGLNVLYDSQGECNGFQNTINALTIDATGNLYAADGGDDFVCVPEGCYELHCGNILAVGIPTPLVSGDANIFGNLAIDASGNLYGSTGTCGFTTPQRAGGMIWQYSPQ